MKIILELQDQPSNIRRITVRHDIVIGRGADCNLRLSAPQVSRRHCFIRVGKDGASITDLDSSNGTFLDGKRIQSGKRFELTDGSVLSLGPIRFRITLQPEVISDSSAPAVSDSVDTYPPMSSRSSSTVIQSGDKVVGNVPPESDDFSLDGGSGVLPANQSPPPAQPPEMASPDSRAEIVGLGRRILDLESGATSDSSRTDVTGELQLPESFQPPGIASPCAADEESVDILDDETARQDHPGVTCEPKFVIDEDADFVEEVEDFDVIEVVDSEDDSVDEGGSPWFAAPQGPAGSGNDVDDNDDDLKRFLKGL
ncbi:MAG: FHA domain-containing protein [Planctomycetaceae bacterium]|nr:FHA domain-containing protein [Planctomycetaceae bacterium]